MSHAIDLATGKTTCGQHRVAGYYLAAGAWLCHGCHQPQEHHETFDETIARNQRAAVNA